MGTLLDQLGRLAVVICATAGAAHLIDAFLPATHGAGGIFGLFGSMYVLGRLL